VADKLDLDINKWLSKTGPKEDVKISDIGINSYQVRFSNVDEKIDEMEEMLTVAGRNFQPILICKADPELPFKYDIIYGQRRLTAAKNLGWKTINAEIINEEVPVVIGQAISLQENEGRVPTSTADIADTIKDLHFDYGLSRNVIKEKLGIPLRIVSEVLWKEELVKEIEETADKYKIKPKVALDIQRKCTVDGVIDVKKTIRMLKAIETFDDELRRKVVKVLQDSPSISEAEAIKQARSAMSATNLPVTFLKHEYTGLAQAAEDDEIEENEYVHKVTIEKLEADKYL
tara:strand:- start:284 stop:1147 length:864 start_codon:yes stop_codon:yes gene_type:complete